MVLQSSVVTRAEWSNSYGDSFVNRTRFKGSPRLRVVVFSGPVYSNRDYLIHGERRLGDPDFFFPTVPTSHDSDVPLTPCIFVKSSLAGTLKITHSFVEQMLPAGVSMPRLWWAAVAMARRSLVVRSSLALWVIVRFSTSRSKMWSQ